MMHLAGSEKIVVTPGGLRLKDESYSPKKAAVKRLKHLVRGVPERRLYATKDWLSHRLRRFAASTAANAN